MGFFPKRQADLVSFIFIDSISALERPLCNILTIIGTIFKALKRLLFFNIFVEVIVSA